jgi:hypothetical protein
MTDREALLALLKRFELTPHERNDGKALPPVAERQITLAAKHGGVEGYSGFEATFDFDESGKFQRLSIWE